MNQMNYSFMEATFPLPGFIHRIAMGYFIPPTAFMKTPSKVTISTARLVLLHRTIICKPGTTKFQVQMSSELLAVYLHGNGTMHQRDFIANIRSIASSVYAWRLTQITAHLGIL